jgi:polyferredoxin
MGLVLLLCGWMLPSNRMRDVYALLAATCCLNAILSIHYLFAAGTVYVGGEARDSDAQAVASVVGLSYWVWALLWFIFAFVMTFIGLVCALDGPDELEENAMPCGDIV